MFKIDYEPDFLDGKYLGNISEDFVKVADLIREASYQVRKRNFSQMPVFPISKVEISIGTILYPKYLHGNEWNYYASFVEEFVQRQIIAVDKVSYFGNTYKNPDEFCCLFVVDEEFVNFVYIPYPNDLINELY